MFVFTLIKGEGTVSDFFSKLPITTLGDRRTSFILDRLEYHREGIFYLYILIEVNTLFKLTLLDNNFFEILTVKDVSLPYDIKRIDFRSLTNINNVPFDIRTNIRSELTIILNILEKLKDLKLLNFNHEFISIEGSKILRLRQLTSNWTLFILVKLLKSIRFISYGN